MQNNKDVNISHSAGNPKPYEAILWDKQKQMAPPTPPLKGITQWSSFTLLKTQKHNISTLT